MRQKLTPKFIGKAKAAPGAERTTYWDSSTPGFGLMVTANGAAATSSNTGPTASAAA